MRVCVRVVSLSHLLFVELGGFPFDDPLKCITDDGDQEVQHSLAYRTNSMRIAHGV